MNQNYIKINDIVIKQPVSFEPNWATTYTADSNRSQSGVGYFQPLFTAESYNAEFDNLSKEEASQILQLIIPTPTRPNFRLTYYSWYYGQWRTDTFYVGQGSMSVKTIKDNFEELKSITCNFIGINPINPVVS